MTESQYADILTEIRRTHATVEVQDAAWHAAKALIHRQVLPGIRDVGQNYIHVIFYAGSAQATIIVRPDATYNIMVNYLCENVTDPVVTLTKMGAMPGKD